MSLAVLGIAAIIFFNFFEIAEVDQYFPPSREAQANDFLALDRWLSAQGISVREMNPGTIDAFKSADEKTIFVQSNLVSWNNDIFTWMDQWIESGGHFILSIDSYRIWDSNTPLEEYILGLGLGPAEMIPDTVYNYQYNDLFPSFGTNMQFNEPEEAVLILKDVNGFARLAQFEKGGGKITVTGRPRFMNNYNLESEANARLCWHLFASGTAADTAGQGVFFIRGERQVEGIVGMFFSRGNLLIIIISCIVLTAAGFWAVIPLFGTVKSEDLIKGKPLTQRFLAEANFYRRFNSLDVYYPVYLREIKRRISKNPDGKDISKAENIQKNKAPNKNEFLKSIIILKTILESL